MGEQLLELNEGLELWRVDVDELREQDKNARFMPAPMMERLQQTIEKDGRLENLPFCAATDKGLEIVSGHHRVRAARAAKVTSLYALVDKTGLTPSQIKAKQLAHNAIQGYDDPQLVRELYEAIDDVDARLEAFIDPEALNLDVEPVSIGNVNIDFDYRTVSIVFLPSEAERFDKAVTAAKDTLNKDTETVYMAELQKVERFREMMQATSLSYEVKAFGTVLGVIADIVLEALGADSPDAEMERTHLAKVCRQAYIPTPAADIIGKALDKLEAEGAIGPTNRWQGLEYLAADYLGTANGTG